MRYLLALKWMGWALLLHACLLHSPSSPAASPWQEALVTLNQPLSIQEPNAMVHSQALDADLSKIHQAEMKTITRDWQPQEAALKAQGLDMKQIRTRRLQFFQDRLQGMNQATLAFLATDTKPGTITASTAASILRAARQHHVASPDRTRDYQRSDEIGFCFGRALLVHYFLLKAGVPQHHMAKIFTIGDLKVGATFWQFHVAVLLKTQAGYVIMDPLHPAPLPVQEWLRINENYSLKAPWLDVRFYITDPRKFLPASGKYEAAKMKNPIYQDYFRRLMLSL
ncbi:MAG: hypothetical protein M3Q07_18620 [Pseudobdellovibrionaceae bacterium]|nr:hypothetical protein [Pseudobdellovibrionaceae bacterium]